MDIVKYCSLLSSFYQVNTIVIQHSFIMIKLWWNCYHLNANTMVFFNIYQGKKTMVMLLYIFGHHSILKSTLHYHLNTMVIMFLDNRSNNTYKKRIFNEQKVQKDSIVLKQIMLYQFNASLMKKVLYKQLELQCI